ncbi:MAG: nuclear transport factor 2 family protein [Acidobacteria bacterium]|nr:nuclear transport factor 2 family protein [Acidobacteriota bacterium]
MKSSLQTAPIFFRAPISRKLFPVLVLSGLALGILFAMPAFRTNAAPDVKKIIADLDTEYQAAVKKNDAATMDKLLADDFVLVVGSGKTYTKADLLADARSKSTTYEKQDDTEQTVRVWGDTAVITAKLWEKGTSNGKPFDKTLWFSDTYVRTPKGWKYVFGQASLPLPNKP